MAGGLPVARRPRCRAHSLDLVEVDADIIVRVVALHCHVYGRLVDARRLG